MIRSIIALISATQALVIMSYFALSFNSGPTVSSLLFSNDTYRGILMTCVVLQITLSSVHVCYHKGLHVVPELLLVTALVSWVTLNVVYEDENGKMLPAHAVAAACFIVSCCIYLVILFIESVNDEPMILDLLYVSGCCIIIALVATIATVTCFLTNSSETWIFEHAAFALFSTTHAILFSIGESRALLR